MMTCPVCNTQLPDGATVCPSCGDGLDATVGVFSSAEIPQAQPVAPATPVQPVSPVQPVYQAPVQPAPPVQPVYQAPVQPAPPVQPVYQAPVQPAPPVQPVYQAPVQPAPPVQPAYGQPAQTGFQQVPYGQIPQQPKKTALVLGIISICLGVIIPLVGYATGIPGIVIGNKEKKLTGSNKGLILSIIGVAVSAVVHLISFMMMF